MCRPYPTHENFAAYPCANPAGALRLQSTPPAGLVAGSLAGNEKEASSLSVVLCFGSRLFRSVCAELCVRWLINHPVDYEAGIDPKTNGGAIVWQPRYGSYTRLTSDGLGKAFFPLILIDQAFWHRDIPASDIESGERFEKRVPLRKVHPDDRKLYGARRLG